MTDYQIVEAMDTYGGSFAKAIAAAFVRADDENVRRLKAAFPELWAEYAALAQLQADRKQAAKV